MLKKVCFFTNKIYLSGGAERVICTLASNFAARGIDTTIITQDSVECGYPLHEDVKIIATTTKCKVPGLRFFMRCLRLRKIIKEISPDAAISFMVDNNLILSLFTLGLSCVRIGSDRIFPKMVTGVRAKLCRVIYPLTDGFVFQTKEAKDCFGGKFRDRSSVIANPLVENIPSRATSITNDIVTVGRLSAQKNHELLIRAFAKFYNSHPDHRLLIYGKGEKKDELQALIDALDLHNVAVLMGTSDKILEDIRDAKMFVLTSDYEGMPNALAEAMAIGLPCISTDCLGGGAAALIEDGVNGRLIPRGDEDELLSAMITIADDTQLAERLSFASASLKDRLAVTTIVQEWISYVEKTIECKNQKGKNNR